MPLSAARPASTHDDGLQPGERPLHEDLARRRRDDSKSDTMLIEAAHILGDEISLLQRDPKLVGTVLPAGGRIPVPEAAPRR